MIGITDRIANEGKRKEITRNWLSISRCIFDMGFAEFLVNKMEIKLMTAIKKMKRETFNNWNK